MGSALTPPYMAVFAMTNNHYAATDARSLAFGRCARLGDVSQYTIWMPTVGANW